MKVLIFIVVLGGVFCVASAVRAQSAETQSFEAGVATVELTPPVGYSMWGYGDRKGVSQGIRDPLMAKALVLKSPENSLAIVTMDIGRCFDKDLLEMIDSEVKSNCGVENVMLVASHTHQGPDMEARTWPSKEHPWQDAAARKVAGVICEACDDSKPAKLGYGMGYVELGHNRRYRKPDGAVRMMWRNETRHPTGPIDPAVTMLRVDDMDGKPLALLVNYACHPVVFGPDNLLLGADYPGMMMKTVEEELGGACMFGQGACGDINPYPDKTLLYANAEREMERAGKRMGEEVLRVARTIETSVPAEPKIGCERETVTFDSRWKSLADPAAFDQIAKSFAPYVEQYGEEFIKAYIARRVKPAEVLLTTSVVNGEYLFAGFPGEFFVDFQRDLRRRSPVKKTFFFGYCNGYQGYFPTIDAAVEGGYGAGDFTSVVEVGAGERLVDKSLIHTYKLLGKLGSVPGSDVPDYTGE